MNEFVYQFQSFCQFRTQLDSRTEMERELLRNNQVPNNQ
jgi:RNA polymerase I-associated factor PAF67